jgi:hypothetical protein
MNQFTAIGFLATAVASFLQAQSPTPAQLNAPLAPPATIMPSSVCDVKLSYDEFVIDERKPPSPRIIPFGKSPIELTISETEFSNRPVDAKTAASPDFCFWNTLSVGTQVSTTGEVASFANGEGEGRGGGGGKVDSDVFARLETLMDHLPDDRCEVPPSTRRVVFEIEKNGAAIVRLYDTANLPDEIIEMIRITGARINILTPVLHPDRIVPSDEARGLNLPSSYNGQGDRPTSPDGSLIVLHDFVTKTLTVYQGSTWPENGGMPQGGKIIRVIQEFWQPDVYGGYLVGTEFSPDGRYLLVTWGERIGALLFDTGTWQPVTDPQIFPQNLKEYLHSPDWSLGIAVTEAGEALVWDAQSHRILSKLPGLGEFEAPQVVHDQSGKLIYDVPNAEIQFASFSPDRKHVAIYSGPDNIFKLRLSIWEIETGKKERDLWPDPWSSYASGQPVWWDDGRLLVAPYSSQFSGHGTGVWDAETGRFKGTLDFTGCDARISSVASGSNLFQSCFIGKEQHDKVIEWSVDSVRNQIDLASRK